MEKRISMKLFNVLLLLLATLLTGCANTPVVTGETEGAERPTLVNSDAEATTAARSQASTAAPEPGPEPGPFTQPSPHSETIQDLLPADERTLWPNSVRGVVSLAAPTDLWERIRAGYAMPDLDSNLVRDREQWYATRPDYIFRMTERSKKYLFHIVEELEVRNMPSELALLPFIESAFNPQAVSSAKAVGMWQFMPATGKHFELKQNAFRDDRRDVLASTRAALDYLKKLYGMFGDWHLALAAYNWGEGRVGRAIAANRKAGKGVGYLDLKMPMETRLYVPKLQAVKNIVANPKAFNSQLPLIENHPYFQSVTIRRDIDVALAAKLAEVPLDDFKALNPSMNRPVIMAAGTPQILLPWDNAKVFQTNLESYSAGRLASWTVWTAPVNMRPGDAAKRVGMSEAELRNVNNIPPRVLIHAGSSLLVPRSARVLHDVSEKVADNGQLSLSPEVLLRKKTVRADRNDTVSSIARKYKVSSANVAQWNNVSPTASFQSGQLVTLFTRPATRAKATARQPAKRRTGQVSKR
jgi:membrane-bound lytic murein transglycosylase D